MMNTEKNIIRQNRSFEMLKALYRVAWLEVRNKSLILIFGSSCLAFRPMTCQRSESLSTSFL
jgi:hypothetical protein